MHARHHPQDIPNVVGANNVVPELDGMGMIYQLLVTPISNLPPFVSISFALVTALLSIEEHREMEADASGNQTSLPEAFLSPPSTLVLAWTTSS
jgi:sterol desaturase/sphingolipid hydroxylase (fatty acid hydroxylase superfamily)